MESLDGLGYVRLWREIRLLKFAIRKRDNFLTDKVPRPFDFLKEPIPRLAGARRGTTFPSEGLGLPQFGRERSVSYYRFELGTGDEF
jgi:hypothetical protein